MEETKAADVAERVRAEDPPECDAGPSMVPPAHVKTPVGMFVWIMT